jgi:hypothetical protein
LIVYGDGAGGTNRYAGLTLIADIHVRWVGFVVNLDAGKLRIILFKEET